MIDITFSSTFKKSYKKRIEGNIEIEDKYWECIKKFIKTPFDKSLKTHKLSGKLKGLWSFSIGYDLRVIFCFEKGNRVMFEDIGNHDEVY